MVRRVGQQETMTPEAIVKFLGTTRLFKGSDAAILGKVAERIRATSYAAGDTIVQAGKRSEVVGVVYQGAARIWSVDAVSGTRTKLRSIRGGDHFGELSSLLDQVSPFAVTADMDTTILQLPERVALQLAKRVPSFAMALATGLAKQLVRAQMTNRRAESLPPPGRGSLPQMASISGARIPAISPLEGSRFGSIPFVRVAQFNVDEKMTSMVPTESLLQHRYLPLELKDNTLIVGMVDPHLEAAKDELARILHGCTIQAVAISQDDFTHSVARLQLDAGQARQARLDVQPGDLKYDKEEQEREADGVMGVIGKEVVQLVDKIVLAAIERGASDIHILEQRADVKVRFRVNGVLQDWTEYIPTSFAKGVVTRIKILSGLDITERRRPQDGRIGLRLGKREVDFRVSTVPAGRGEKIVMRIFQASTMMRPLEQIFLEPRTLKAVRAALQRPFGAVVVAGPTGSGKSSTLYAGLSELRQMRPDANICVVEDPIEYRLDGTTQVQVNHAVDLSFARVLRAFLRQDPDVIMVGEMRDAATASIGLEAAMTGHIVLSSFHANDAFSAIERLLNLDCSRSMIAQSLSLIMVQRLVRRLCDQCAITTEPPPVLVRSLIERGLIEKSAVSQLPKAQGCDACGNTGYVGRIAVVESLRLNDKVSAALMAGQPLHEIEKAALADEALVPFKQYASYLMARKVITPGDALMAVAG